MPADGPDAQLYELAVKRAIETVNADGGLIATLDDSRSMMVVRVRQVHPRAQTNLVRPTRSRPIHTPQHQIDEANTTVLSAAQLWRIYRRGERLVGTVWQNGESVILSGDEVHGLGGNGAPEDPPEAWYLAVPIFATSADESQNIMADPPVIGVLAVYVKDPRWRFTQNHLHLLETQAHNIALSLLLAQVGRQEQRHRRLIQLLQELTSDVPSFIDAEIFYETFADRMRVAIGGMVDTQAFALVVPHTIPGQAEALLSFYATVDDGQRYAPYSLSEEQAPWWAWVRYGRNFTWMTDEERHANPQLQVRAWGSHNYMDSQLFVPIKAPSGVVGALLVASSRANAYNEEQVRLLEMAGRFIGLAIEHAQMRNARRTAGNTSSDSERALAVLNNSLLGLNASLEIATIVHDLVEQASELTRGQVCVYLEYATQTDELVLRDIAQNKDHPHAELIGQHFPVGQGRRRQAVQGQSQSLENLASEYQRGDAIGMLLEQEHVRAMLLAPVIQKESVTQRDRVLGLLAVYAPDQPGLFSPAEIMNLMALGHVAASALNNAHTYAQLRELDRLKDEFILTASHEFRTPMSAIQGFSWLIQRRVATMTAEQGQHWAGEIIRATEQLKDMMDTVTESWRTQSVQIPSLEAVQIASTVQLAMEISAGLITAENHVVQTNVPEDLWVKSDQDRLRHVISNLLVNATKYSATGTQILLNATVKSGAELLALPRERGDRRDETGEEEQVVNVTPQSGPWVVVSVHDQGMGITAANQKRLFAKFVRLQLTTPVRGTGLGLYICRRYIEAMGGEIWVDSAPGQGSTFSFCLPQVPAPTT
jgi:signal transduction histidine kinase